MREETPPGAETKWEGGEKEKKPVLRMRNVEALLIKKIWVLRFGGGFSK